MTGEGILQSQEPKEIELIGLNKFSLVDKYGIDNFILLGIVLYFIKIVIFYIIFKTKQHKNPFIDALKISWIWGIIILLILLYLYIFHTSPIH